MQPKITRDPDPDCACVCVNVWELVRFPTDDVDTDTYSTAIIVRSIYLASRSDE